MKLVSVRDKIVNSIQHLVRNKVYSEVDIIRVWNRCITNVNDQIDDDVWQLVNSQVKEQL